MRRYAFERIVGLLAVWCWVLLASIGWLSPRLNAGEIPEEASDQKIDQWLRVHSRTYRGMAEAVDARGGLDIERESEVQEGDRKTKVPKGLAYVHQGRRKIVLNPSLKSGAAASVMIFELTNHYQEGKHAEINQEAVNGNITSPDEFGILRQLVEFDGLRIHRSVLEELEAATGTLSPDFFSVFPTAARTLKDYELPSVYFLIKSEKKSGHRDYYKQVFNELTCNKPLAEKASEEAKGIVLGPSR